MNCPNRGLPPTPLAWVLSPLVCTLDRGSTSVPAVASCARMHGLRPTLLGWNSSTWARFRFPRLFLLFCKYVHGGLWPGGKQITSCFEKISCFGLTHPGFDVVKKTYKGEISKVQPSFLRLLNAYVRHIFGELVSGTSIQGKYVSFTFSSGKGYILLY